MDELCRLADILKRLSTARYWREASAMCDKVRTLGMMAWSADARHRVYPQAKAEAEKFQADGDSLSTRLSTEYTWPYNSARRMIERQCPQHLALLPIPESFFDVDPIEAATACTKIRADVLAMIKEREPAPPTLSGEGAPGKTPAVMQYLAWLEEWEAEKKASGETQAAFARRKNIDTNSIRGFFKLARDHRNGRSARVKTVKKDRE